MQEQTSNHSGFKTLCRNSADKCRLVFINVVVPRTREGVRWSYNTCRQHLWPKLRAGSIVIKNELIKIHQKQNWTQRFKATFVGNAIGMGIAMLSANLIGGFIEVAGLENMWGLFSTQTVVSETTYKVVSFAVELFVALVVFSIVEYYLDEYKQRREAQRLEQQVDDDYDY